MQLTHERSAWTIGRLLNWTTDFLREKKADSPRLDAEVLLAFARGCKRIELYTAFDEPASDDLRERFRALVRERAAGKPVAYLVGKREFYSLSFEVTPDVLIPRPETELVVVRALDLAKLAAGPVEIADVGTGSGILAVTLAKHLPQARVTAIDVGAGRLAVAERNAHLHGVANQLTFIESDLLASLPAEQQFHLIVSNPPYVRSDELAALADDVRRYEPRVALDGGPEGTSVIERLLPQAVERLRSGGWLVMEIGVTTAAATESLIDATPGLVRKQIYKDLAGLPRVIVAQRGDSP